MQSNHIILFAKCQELIAKYLLHFYFIYKIDPILIKKQKRKALSGKKGEQREMTLDRRL